MKRKIIFTGLFLSIVFIMLLSGCACKHDWVAATCIAPKTCSKCGEYEGEERGHNWSDATCEAPKTCRRCGATEGNNGSHKWVDATCEKPKTCSVCGETTGTTKDHKWIYGDENTPDICSVCNKMRPLKTPSNGQIFYGENLSRYGELTIHNDGNGCYVKLKTASKKDVFAFYVKANSTCTINVPTGNYYVYFASGKDWYGPEYCFGEETAYSMDDEILDFTNYSWEYTLTPVVNGNLTLDDIPASEF